MDLARNLIGRINVGDSLTRTAASRPDQLAVVDCDRRFTYAEFNAYVNRLAHGLAAKGYARGDALALASGNSADFLAVYYACAKLGVVCVPVNLGWRPDEVAYVLGHSRARGIVVETQLVTVLRDAIAQVPGVRDVIVAPDGLLNHVLQLLGADPASFFNRGNWLGNGRSALQSVMVLNVWTTSGTVMLFYLAGLTAIPLDVYEQASVDGAGTWQRFRRITFPMLAPSHYLVAVTSVIGALQLFDQAYIAGGSDGSPDQALLTMVLYLYNAAFRQFESKRPKLCVRSWNVHWRNRVRT